MYPILVTSGTKLVMNSTSFAIEASMKALELAFIYHLQEDSI